MPSARGAARPRGEARSDGDRELYGLAGEIACVAQEVANRVEMCVASKRHERDRLSNANMPGADRPKAVVEAEVPLPGRNVGEPVGIPGSRARMGEKADYLKYHWRRMSAGRQGEVDEDRFAAYVTGSDAARNTVAHSTASRAGGALINVREGRKCGKADLEEFLGRAYLALDAMDRLCLHMGLDYDEYVRQRLDEAALGADGKSGTQA